MLAVSRTMIQSVQAAQMTTSNGFMPNRPHIIAVAIFDGIVLGDVAPPCELLAAVRLGDGKPGYTVKICGPGPDVATRHCRLRPPYSWRALHSADTILLPGVDNIDRELPDMLRRAVRRAASRGARVVSICTGAFLLAATGLLNGARATTHWMAAAELTRRYPEIDVDANVLYVDNGKVLTSAGATAGLDLCLHMIRIDYGAAVAARAARMAVMPLERAGGQAQFIRHQPPVTRGALAPLLAWIEQNLDQDLNVVQIASAAAMSLRTLHRKFAEQTGTTPASWVLRARIQRAQELLVDSNLPMEEISARVGFGSASTFRDRFRSAVGTSPSSYRKAFRANEPGDSAHR
jgi:transcriptional regulator GlxA family with amidase domain